MTFIYPLIGSLQSTIRYQERNKINLYHKGRKKSQLLNDDMIVNIEIAEESMSVTRINKSIIKMAQNKINI